MIKPLYPTKGVIRGFQRSYSVINNQYGRYSTLDPSNAIKTYPPIRPVPNHIHRPEYVPKNFFEARWGYHEDVEGLPTLSQEEGRIRPEGENGLREVARTAKEVLRLIEGHVRVRALSTGYEMIS